MPGLFPINERSTDTESRGGSAASAYSNVSGYSEDHAFGEGDDDESGGGAHNHQHHGGHGGVEEREQTHRESIFEWRDPMEHISTEEAEAQLVALERQTELKRRETAMFEEYIHKQKVRHADDLEVMRKQSKVVLTAEQEEEQQGEEELKDNTGGAPKKSPGSRRRSRRSGAISQSKKEKVTLYLRTVDKIHVASEAMHNIQKRMKATISQLETKKRNTIAVADESLEQMGEIDQYYNRFSRWVLGQTDYQGYYSSERWGQYVKERLQTDGVMKDALHQRLLVTRASLQKAEGQMEQEDRMDSVTRVDFEQLQISNTQFTTALAEGIRAVVDHKRRVMNATTQLNREMSNIKKTTKVNTDLQTQIHALTHITQTLEKEMKHVVAENEKQKQMYADLKDQVKTFRAPSVLEFINEMVKIDLAKANVIVWERKLKIAQTDAQQHKLAWKMAKAASEDAMRNGFTDKTRTMMLSPTMAPRMMSP